MTEHESNIASKAIQLHDDGQQREAIDLLRSAYATSDAPSLHVLEGQLILLSDWDIEEDLSGVEKAYYEALRLDDTYVDAYLELGWFYYGIMDDAEKGEGFFKEAERLSRSQLMEALEGKLKCIAEREKEAAEQLFSQIDASFFTEDDRKRLTDAIEDSA